MGKTAERIAQRVQKITTAIEAEAAPEAAPTESATAPEPSAAAPPTSGSSEAVSASADAPVTAPETDARATKHDLLSEKLAAIRDQRQRKKAESKLSEREKTISEKEREAEEARKAATEERAKYDALRTGTFRDTLKALGRDPLEAFKEMQQEAIEAGKPEAELRRMRYDFEKQMGEKLKPLEETIAELQRQNEELLNERQQTAAERSHQAFVADYQAALETKDAEGRATYHDLRIEYGDRRLFGLVDSMKRNPPKLRAYAKELGVRLTFPDNRFNMTDIFNVLDAAHKAHEAEKKQRRDQMQAPTTSPGAPQQASANAQTVNGTAERRNAATNPLGNDSAASKASAPPSRSRVSKQGRIDRAMARDAARRG